MKLDRAYFKEKHTGKKADSQYTVCCGELIDRHILNKNSEADYALMEDYVEASLLYNTGTEYMKIECCEECGRLLKYVSVLTQTKDNWK